MRRLLVCLIALCGSLLLLELVLRLLDEPPRYPANAREDLFWERDEELGWQRRPGSEGYFSNGWFRGWVTNDEHGNRRNSRTGTYVDGYDDVLFLGDSTAASLEVDDDETVPALLEASLRERGLPLNVVNLGVRGYGTDQAVRRALVHAPRLRPRLAIYLFADNDFFDNNVLKQPLRRYGKGVYVLDSEGGLEAIHYPVPDYEPADFGGVVLDPEGEPQVRRGRSSPPLPSRAQPLATVLGPLADFSVLTQRLLAVERRLLPGSPHEQKLKRFAAGARDPWQVAETGSDEFLYALLFGLQDGGSVLDRHRGYYQRQMAEILALLRQIGTLERTVVVIFPGPRSLRRLDRGDESVTASLFADLERVGTVDLVINLNRILIEQDVALASLQCTHDGHFCEAGNRWIADVLQERLPLDFLASEKDAQSTVSAPNSDR